MALVRKCSVHAQQIDGAIIRVSHRQLAEMTPVLQSLAIAKQLESRYPERALQLFDALVETQVKQLTALGRLRRQPCSSVTNSRIAADNPMACH